MNEPDISPLAKRLAEENNVRWQELNGTGAGGKVVERDVLEYLARVMSGEEAVDPTPEPLPEGMDAWPEEDVVGFQSETSAGQLSDLQAELAASERAPGSPVLDLDEPSLLTDEVELATPDLADHDLLDDFDTVAGDDISEDIFLFEDGDDELDVEADQSEPVAAMDDGLLIAGDELYAEPTQAEADPEGLDLGDLDPFDDDDAPIEMAAHEVGSFETVEPDEELPDLFVSDSDEGSLEATGEETDELEPLLLEEDVGTAEEARADAHEHVEPVLAAEQPEPTGPIGMTAVGEALGGHAEVVAPEQAEEEGLADEATLGVISTTEPGLPLVRYGTLLRRHLNLNALAAAQLAVSRELAIEEPVAPTPFLVRAAAKAVAAIGLGAGDVAAARFESGLTLQRLAGGETMPFRELLAQLDSHDPESADPDSLSLVVADMSSLDVDEAVLNLGVPVLTLGRILYDNQQGSYRSTLSLAGDVEPDRGAKLLSQVAGLLDSPVQLVL